MNMSLHEFEQFISFDISLSEYLLTMTECIQSVTGCEHAGIRIKDDKGNIPYATLIGFENEDWRSTEPFINTNRDCCVCTRINEGALDPYDCCFTSGRGSFHINAINDFTANLDDQKATRYIGKCLDFGVESMSLVPLISGNTIRGNIHVADMRPGTITTDMVLDMEAVAPIIARRIEHSSKRRP